MLSESVPVNLSVPVLIVVFPENVLEPDKVKIPDPVLVRSPNPEITPEIVSLPESPVVKVIPFANSMFPEPCKELIVSLVSTS